MERQIAGSEMGQIVVAEDSGRPVLMGRAFFPRVALSQPVKFRVFGGADIAYAYRIMLHTQWADP